ncbi:unnamed protein product [Sympodiomycopsis kandeliae]
MSDTNDATPHQRSSSSGSTRRLSNPFTRNQDNVAAISESLKRQSIGQTSTYSETIEEGSDEEHYPAPLGPGPHLQRTTVHSGSAQGTGSAVDDLSIGQDQEDGQDGLPLKPSLRPAGGGQRSVKINSVEDPNVVYGDDAQGELGHQRRNSIETRMPTARQRGIIRTYSMAQQKRRPPVMNDDRVIRQRRLSHDAVQESPRRFIVDVQETMRLVLEQEDTDGNFQISVTDSGPKVLSLGTATSNGYKGVEIRGHYMLSNLLQELALAHDHGRKRIMLDESRLTENPVDRLSRMISQTFWHNLTRRIDASGIERILSDPKNRSKNQHPRIYVPAVEKKQIAYYQKFADEHPDFNLTVEILPEVLTADYTRDQNDKPGLLALAMREVTNEKGEETLEGIPFIVPGARFNELYNWDSYFIALGLVVDNMVDMAKGVVEHFIFEIRHYGKILNGNRSYYLMRSQPPFLTDMALQVYSRLDPENEEENKVWLKKAIQAAIKEYHTVWMSEPRLDRKTGLSRYRCEGRGVPPETEASHFTHVLRPYAEKYGVSVNEFTHKYNFGEIDEPELDTYFMHDRAVRESGHDTSYRLEKKCADLATIDLQSLLYKYEVDIGTAIKELFDDDLELEDDFIMHAPLPPSKADATPPTPSRSIETRQTSAEWFARAAFRKQQVDKYCWNEGQGLYFDYDTRKEESSHYESVTAYWAMWAGMASEHQASKLVHQSLKKFEVKGGLIPGTEDSRGKITLERPNRQWDYPFAWPPHQMLAWVGLERYGYLEEARRLAYRWLYLMTSAFFNFNGVVPEKFDAVSLSHMVMAEYGNQGIDFKFVPREGFGWANASFQVGLTFLTEHQRRAVAALQDYDSFIASTKGRQHDQE